MKAGSGPRRSRGEIERLPSGSLRVRVYTGLDPVSKKRRYLTATVPGGPEAEAEAEQVRSRLLGEAAERKALRGRKAADRGRGPGAAGSPIAGSGGRDLSAPDVSGAAGGEDRRGQLTVAAIARMAGVSAPTVSKVLNGRAGVAPETRRLVELLLREQGYRRPEKVVRAAVVEVVFYGMHGHRRWRSCEACSRSSAAKGWRSPSPMRAKRSPPAGAGLRPCWPVDRPA
jgi:LacI family xylobiose transport system transcriptional regulator